MSFYLFVLFLLLLYHVYITVNKDDKCHSDKTESKNKLIEVNDWIIEYTLRPNFRQFAPSVLSKSTRCDCELAEVIHNWR